MLSKLLLSKKNRVECERKAQCNSDIALFLPIIKGKMNKKLSANIFSNVSLALEEEDNVWLTMTNLFNVCISYAEKKFT